MRRRDEHRRLDEVFPRPGELALREHLGLERVRAAALTDDDHAVAGLDARGRPAFERRQAELAERLDQPESGDEIVGERMAGNDRAVVAGEPDGLGLGDEIADREHEAVVADDDAIARPLGAEDRRGEGVLRYLRAQRHHRIEHRVEVERDVGGLRLQISRKTPIRFGHGSVRASEPCTLILSLHGVDAAHESARIPVRGLAENACRAGPARSTTPRLPRRIP